MRVFIIEKDFVEENKNPVLEKEVCFDSPIKR